MNFEDSAILARSGAGDAGRLLHAFLADTVARVPGQMALDIPPGRDRAVRATMTYAELADASDRLARHLAPMIAEEAIVALLLPRTSPLLYVAQLAVLKAGAAFTCLDPSFPEERMREILEDAEPVAVLADAEGLARLAPLVADPARLFDADALLARTPPAGDLPEGFAADRLAYVIYTSGTTGRPKGVMIEHRNIASLVASDIAEFGLTTADRVVQGSSSAYDSSLEETWLAFATGATLLVMDDAAARLGPDIVGWLRDERATVFCPPPTLLRSSGCADPERALPDLKLLYVGGEALPRDIADLWQKGRRLVNGYGPTECAVTCLRGDIVPGKPITIGAPVPGMRAWVLEEAPDGALNEVAEGMRGELCMGGAGVARGYRNRPDLTAEKFCDHPRLGRIYRTGDLVHREADGNFYYHGRIDAQVKLRGYRVELGEIEARLAELPGVRAAGCRMQDHRGVPELVAFVVADDPRRPPDLDTLRGDLLATLPRYMVPREIALIDDLPTTVGGKLNRAALPLIDIAAPATGSNTGAARRAEPATEMERLLAAGMADILKRGDGVSVEDDFFEELGGDSLSAALLVTLLRDDPRTDWITVSDIYEARTVRALALLADRAMPAADAADEAPLVREGVARPRLAQAVQTGWLLVELAAGGWLTWFAAFQVIPRLFGHMSMTAFVLLAPLAAVAALALYVPAAILFAVLVKRLAVGRYRAVRAPVWSTLYLRHWVVFQAVRLIPWPLIQGTVVQQAALRALGARIGRNVHIARGVDLRRGGWDLLTIGDNAALGQDAHIGLSELDRGDIVFGAVTIGEGATLGVRAGVEGDCHVGAGSVLTALSILNAGGTIPPGELWDGVPASRVGPAPDAPAPAQGTALSPALHSALLLAAEGLAALVAALPAELLSLAVMRRAGVTYDAMWAWMAHPAPLSRTGLVLIGLTVAAVPLTLVWSALMLRAMGRVKPGTIGRFSPAYVRVWIKTGMLHAAGEWLSGTVFWSKWLRLSGMRVGASCEISTIIDVVPELVEIGAETFFADGIYLGGADVRAGTVTLGTVELGRNTFLGNHAVIPANTRLPDDILIGIATVARPDLIAAGQSRFGHPCFDLPRREVVDMDRSLTHDPSPVRYWNRVFWEVARFALPVLPLLLSALWYAMVARGRGVTGDAAFALLVLPGAMLAPVVALLAAVWALKWTLIGRVKPGQHALWSCWCSRWDYVYVAWAKYANLILQRLEGTFLLLGFLRAMGLTIGKRAVLGPQFAQVVDPDMIHIGDGATVTAMFQAHTFEDRVLKVDKVFIGKGATIGAGTVPLYGADVGDGARVGGHSVIMKQERLLPGLRYQGVPTRVMGRERG